MLAQLRAAVIALAIVIGLVDGLPLPPRGEAKPWQRPIIDTVRPVQRALLVPFAWIGRDLRFSQRWALFQAASAQRYRMEVAGRGSDGAWHVVFRAGADDDELLAYRRVRGAWNPPNQPTSQYASFVTWLAARARASHPDFTSVRVRMENVVLDHGEVRDTGAYTFVQTRP